MRKVSLAAIAAAAVVSLSGCAPSETEIAEVKSHVVETFRHYDSLCVGLPTEADGGTDWRGDQKTYNPYLYCMRGGSGYGLPTYAASEKAWREVKDFCGAITDEALAEICWDEAESQYMSRPQVYPDRSPRS